MSQLTTDQEHTEVPKHGSQVPKKEDSEEDSDSDSESDSDSDSSHREDTVLRSQRASGMVVASEKKPGVIMTRGKLTTQLSFGACRLQTFSD